jgi:hypothetical protein
MDENKVSFNSYASFIGYLEYSKAINPCIFLMNTKNITERACTKIDVRTNTSTLLSRAAYLRQGGEVSMSSPHLQQFLGRSIFLKMP